MFTRPFISFGAIFRFIAPKEYFEILLKHVEIFNTSISRKKTYSSISMSSVKRSKRCKGKLAYNNELLVSLCLLCRRAHDSSPS